MREREGEEEEVFDQASFFETVAMPTHSMVVPSVWRDSFLRCFCRWVFPSGVRGSCSVSIYCKLRLEDARSRLSTSTWTRSAYSGYCHMHCFQSKGVVVWICFSLRLFT